MPKVIVPVSDEDMERIIDTLSEYLAEDNIDIHSEWAKSLEKFIVKLIKYRTATKKKALKPRVGDQYVVTQEYVDDLERPAFNVGDFVVVVKVSPQSTYDIDVRRADGSGLSYWAKSKLLCKI